MIESELIQRYKEEKISSGKLRAGIEQNKGYLQESLDKCLGTSESKDGAQGKESNALSDRLDQVCDVFLKPYTRADLLAAQYQTYYKRGSIFIYLFAVLAVLAVTVQALFNIIPHWTILIEVISIFCIIFIIGYGNRRGWHKRWIDYRFLAERFRCAIFMALLDEKAFQDFSTLDLYHLSDEDKWIFTVLRDAWSEWEQNKQQKPVPFDRMKMFIQCGWLEDQKVFHKKSIGRHARTHKQLSWTGLVLFYELMPEYPVLCTGMNGILTKGL